MMVKAFGATYIFLSFILASSHASAHNIPCRAKLIFVKKDTAGPAKRSAAVEIRQKWQLPDELRKVSGIAVLDSTRIVCVHDEVGSLFIYNFGSNQIERQIPFGPVGDYEAVAVVKDAAYVACADGRLYEVDNFQSERPVTKEYGTHLTVRQNVDGLCYDAQSKMLLVAIKGKESDQQLWKGIYCFDPQLKKMAVRPCLKIDLQDTIFGKSVLKKNASMMLQPSEIAVHPDSGDLYVTDAVHQQLLVTDKSANIKWLYTLPKAGFPQPEGIAFSAQGDCYISCAGNKQQPATLLLVTFKTDQ